MQACDTPLIPPRYIPDGYEQKWDRFKNRYIVSKKRKEETRNKRYI